ncbi:hypothetical protein AWB79_04931 [Caballeronia hypogeia]|uniref:Uncharacterized protein n=2 Tax=Caballeronia hypogeia TaxID=1777140 RepID=A0A158C8J3_9BURK|nr:hypothetical protein AWB79_04931 [Caballeronia hypogeia]
MFRSHSIPGAAALVACFLSFSAVAAGPVHTAAPLPDARILSAAPFVFQADREIFSNMQAEPSDSRIFKSIEPMRSVDQFPDNRLKRQSMI